MSGRVAVLVAPYAPAQHLGASKKIEGVARLLHGIGRSVHLVDSSHAAEGRASAVIDRAFDLAGTPVRLWRPPCLADRRWGKLVNVLQAARFASRLVPAAPSLVWIYNSYAFEARAALALRRRTDAALVLELEDLPLARGRGLNPKPWIDSSYFPRLLEAADLVTFVNAVAMKRFGPRCRRALLLPSLLQQALVDLPPRPRFAGGVRRLGYFGGLSQEKGAGLLLEAVPRMPPGWKLVVTGTGELAAAFEAMQRGHSSTLEFHGMVDHAAVLSLMHGCDAIVNPHAPISQMDEGVFPFKVCEALASGALLISTALPSIDIDLSRSVLFFDGTAGGLAAALAAAADHHERQRDAIAATRRAVCDRCGEGPVKERLKAELDAVAGAR